MSRYFETRLFKALGQKLCDVKSIREYCTKQASKNYSEEKVHDYQCICEYLCYRVEHNVRISFSEYQQIMFNEMNKKNN